MTRRYTYTTHLEVGDADGGPEYEVEVSYVVYPAEPETGPSYACGGTPASDAYLDDLRLVKVDGKPRPWGMYDGWIANEDDEFETVIVGMLEDNSYHVEAMLNEAAEEDAADRDAADEARWDAARDESRWAS